MTLTRELILQMRRDFVSMKTIAYRFGVKRGRLYRMIGKIKKPGG